VVGESEEALETALPKIKVDYDPLPAVFSALEAMANYAPKVHGNSNIQSAIRIIRGDADSALATAWVVISRRLRLRRLVS